MIRDLIVESDVSVAGSDLQITAVCKFIADAIQSALRRQAPQADTGNTHQHGQEEERKREEEEEREEQEQI